MSAKHHKHHSADRERLIPDNLYRPGRSEALRMIADLEKASAKGLGYHFKKADGSHIETACELLNMPAEPDGLSYMDCVDGANPNPLKDTHMVNRKGKKEGPKAPKAWQSLAPKNVISRPRKPWVERFKHPKPYVTQHAPPITNALELAFQAWERSL